MNLEINQQELNYLINGVVEELNQIEEAVYLSKAMLELDCLIKKGKRAKGIELFEDYIARHRLLIKLWDLSKDKKQAKESIAFSWGAMNDALEVIEKIKHLAEVPSDRKARQN